MALGVHLDRRCSMSDHPTGNPEAIKPHRQKQREADQELSKVNIDAPTPGKGRPDKEEGVGTVQRRMG